MLRVLISASHPHDVQSTTYVNVSIQITISYLLHVCKKLLIFRNHHWEVQATEQIIETRNSPAEAAVGIVYC